jgi:hypothetical protein
MTLIDRYVQEIGSRLPIKQRTDIQAEIKSLIQDMLQDKSAKTGRPVDEALTIEVIKEMGKPEKVAATYLPSRSLIGPVLFPSFWWVLKISLVLVLAITVIIFAAQGAIGAQNIWLTIGDSLSNMILTFGWVVLIFAVIEWLAPSIKSKRHEKEWNPAELMRKPDGDTIPLSTPIAGIVLTLTALVLFNGFHGIPVLINLSDGKLMTQLSLSDEFLRFMPLLNVLWGLMLVFYCVTLIQRRWSAVLRLANIGLQVFGIVIVALLLGLSKLIDINSDTLNALNAAGVPKEKMLEIVNIGGRVLLGAGIAAMVIQIGTTGYKFLKNRVN